MMNPPKIFSIDQFSVILTIKITKMDKFYVFFLILTSLFKINYVENCYDQVKANLSNLTNQYLNLNLKLNLNLNLNLHLNLKLNLKLN